MKPSSVFSICDFAYASSALIGDTCPSNQSTFSIISPPNFKVNIIIHDKNNNKKSYLKSY